MVWNSFAGQGWKDEKPFSTQCYMNGKNVVICGHEFPMLIMITALLASENIATMEMRSGYSVLPSASSGLMNSVFSISFFPQS